MQISLGNEFFLALLGEVVGRKRWNGMNFFVFANRDLSLPVLPENTITFFLLM